MTQVLQDIKMYLRGIPPGTERGRNIGIWSAQNWEFKYNSCFSHWAIQKSLYYSFFKNPSSTFQIIQPHTRYSSSFIKYAYILFMRKNVHLILSSPKTKKCLSTLYPQGRILSGPRCQEFPPQLLVFAIFVSRRPSGCRGRPGGAPQRTALWRETWRSNGARRVQQRKQT